MRAGAWLSGRLNCAVRFVHHSGKGNARSGIVDQYAGRGGSAGADNARFVHVLTQHTQDGDGYTAPGGCPPEALPEGRLLRLHVAKLSHGRRPSQPIWLLRQGFTFEHLKPTAFDAAEIERERLRRLHDFLSREGGLGVKHTRSSLDDRLSDLGMTRSEMRAALHTAIERGHVVELEIPRAERIGARKTYLAAGVVP